MPSLTGPRSYTHFCRCGKQLDEALHAAGAQRAVPRQDVNKEDWEAISAWMEAVLAALPKLGLRPVGEEGVAAAAGGKRKGQRRGKREQLPMSSLSM
jgi:sulfite reductase (NADPH) flavoprotein alpha-component